MPDENRTERLKAARLDQVGLDLAALLDRALPYSESK